MKTISLFKNEFGFLSNFHISPFVWNGYCWNTVEHAYQAAKAKFFNDRWLIRIAKTPAIAKNLGRSVSLREDWEQVKVSIMTELVWLKFEYNPTLRDKLIDTDPAELVEGNWWHDNFWGDCFCKKCLKQEGKNMLGFILMEVRKDLLLEHLSQLTTTIKYVSGDIFVNRYGAQALAHGCNCRGAMGAGIAKSFREYYPNMYEEYRRRCKTKPREFNLGDSFFWKAVDKPSVFNLGIMDDWQHSARYDAIELALEMMKQQADEESIQSIAMPRIGAGLGGLSWKKICSIVECVFNDWPGTLYVYEEFRQEE